MQNCVQLFRHTNRVIDFRCNLLYGDTKMSKRTSPLALLTEQESSNELYKTGKRIVENLIKS